MSTEREWRTIVASALDWERAHVWLDRAIDGLAPAQRGRRPRGAPHSIWEQVEHIRLAQRDLFDFCRSAAYEASTWPDDYWPSERAPADDKAWTNSLRPFAGTGRRSSAGRSRPTWTSRRRSRTEPGRRISAQSWLRWTTQRTMLGRSCWRGDCSASGSQGTAPNDRATGSAGHLRVAERPPRGVPIVAAALAGRSRARDFRRGPGRVRVMYAESSAVLAWLLGEPR